jgi:hypothetical protein
MSTDCITIKKKQTNAEIALRASSLGTLAKLVNHSKLLPALKAVIDRSFVAVVDEQGNQVVLRVTEQDSGQEFMTVADLAIILQTTQSKIRAMTKSRAQKASRHPVPFLKIHGKSLRFRRTDIMEWLGGG